MQLSNEVTTVSPKAEAPSQAPRAAINPASADPLVNKGDMSFLRAKATMETYATALPGTAPREFFDRVAAGEPVNRAADRVKADFGFQVPGEDRAAFMEYQAKRLQVASPLEVSIEAPSAAFARPGAAAPAPGAYAPETKQAPTLNLAQRQAVTDFKVNLNEALGKSAGALGEMEAHGLTGTQEYREAATRHDKLVNMAAPSLTAQGLAQSREAANARLKVLADQGPLKMPDGTTKYQPSPALVAHYETVARAGGPVSLGGEAAARRVSGLQDQVSKAQFQVHELELKGKELAGASPAQMQRHQNDLDQARKSLAALQGSLNQAKFPLGTGIPKPSVNGRFAGFENPADMPLERGVAVQMALKADPAGQEAKALVAWAERSPKEMGLDDKALQSMWEDRRAQLDAHKASMDAPISAAPAAAKTLAERMAEQSAAGPVSDPWGIPSRDSELPHNSDTPPRQGNGPPAGGGEGPTVSEGPQGRAAGQGKAWEPPMTPEAHSAAALQKQIAEVEARAEKEMNRQRFLLALSLAGNVLASSAEAAVAIGTAPINGNAAQSINAVASGMRDGINRSGEYLEQKQRVITKADTDIKGLLAQQAKEQRDVAEAWNEKMSNQMDHLKNVPVPVEVLDKAEEKAGEAVQARADFAGNYEQDRDRDAAAIHLAAADEMRMSPDPAIQKIGNKVAQEIIANDDRGQRSWADTEKAVQSVLAQEPAAIQAFKGYRAGVEDQHREWSVKNESHRLIVQAMSPEAKDPTNPAEVAAARESRVANLAVLVGRPQAEKLETATQKVVAEEAAKGNITTNAQVVADSLAKKATIERSVSGAWREFTAQAPVHAQAVVTGGISAEAQIASLYGRRQPEALSPDRKAVQQIREHFLGAMAPEPGKNLPKVMAEEGIPAGWGVSTNLGRKVGIALSQNASVQSLMVGHNPQGKLQEASIHLFGRERATVTDDGLRGQGLSDREVKLFRESQAGDGLVRAHISIKAGDLTGKGTDSGQLASILADRYNGAVKDAFQKQQSGQLDRDSWRFAAVKLGIQDPREIAAFGPATAGKDLAEASKLAFAFKQQFQDGYAERARVLVARESISRSVARPMAAQILAAKESTGFQQIVETNRGGHFTYPPSQSALDPNPAKGLGSDFKRLMTAADHKFTGIYDELTQARAKGVSLMKDPHLLEKAGDKSKSIGAVLDSPIRQSEMGGRPAGGNDYHAFTKQFRG